MITFPQHAEDEMLKDGISREEAEACLEHGELVIKQVVKGELRYGKQLQLKGKEIVVIYTLRKEETRVVTCYTVRRKRWQPK
ncbi:DUF4258 domain-containing protein [Candidatus Woesearchaeota archaeon]|nr:DUF4258 domain-containing protein [Candidatus Woesearchaeota archaeon]